MDDMLGSLYANGHCQDALVIIFALDPDLACMRLAAKYQAMLIPCRPLSPINAMCKALLYSVAQVINAEKFLCLDSDMLILGDLRPVFAALDACPSGSILTCREGNGQGFTNLHHAYQSVYWGTSDDWENVFSGTTEEAAYPLVVNDGLFAGSRTALLALDGVIRAIPKAAEWSDKHRNNWWRNQFVFNLALARLRCGMELDSTYNVQLHVQEVKLSEQHKQIQADWHGRAVRVLHFSGAGRQKYPAWRGRFARIGDPVVGRSHGDAYSTFLEALRIWVGQNGLASLAWSFYGKTDGKTADVKDISTFALLALLHYLIRTNGCVRVFETGTARGVSAACLASAVAHRSGGQIVSFDPYPHPERTDLWSLLPIEFQNCIEQRAVGSVEGMASAIDAGERYDAALLDSIHTEEHVWDEFQLATRLVCPGGLILIHDVYYIHGTVEAAIQRIKAAGYGVVRLWTAESGVAEDDHLGLAVIENRK
jgi:predicted O-methyltransferase YrrM